MNSMPGSNARPDWPLAVVLGAGGLGMAVARRLGMSHRLLLADRNPDHLARKIDELAGAGYDATGQSCDVAVAADILQLAECASSMGKVHSLAYVVGLSPSLGDFRTIMSVNLIGPAKALAAFQGRMAPGGAALCISSSAAHMQEAAQHIVALLDDPLTDDFVQQLGDALGSEAHSANAYMLSKKGLIRLCQRKARQWGEMGLRIVSLSPGLIATPQGAGEYGNSPGKMGLFKATALGREATMLEIADVADFLLSDRASFITGTDLLVDGGLVAALGCREFT